MKKPIAFTLILIFIFFIFSFIRIANLYKNLADSFIKGDSDTFNNNLLKLTSVLTKDQKNKIFSILGNKKYLVIFQNNMELRPIGGFIGSYATINIKNNVFDKIEIKDIYVPDGQIQGHIDPPIPIQQAFQTGDFRLPNANWYPDYPKSAETLNWFFEKGGENNIDSIIAINLSLIQELLKITGDTKPYDFPESINSNNFYQIIQSYAEDDFFPGSIKKQSYLSGLGISLISRIKDLGLIDQIKFVLLMKKQLDEKQILIWYKDQNLEKEMTDLGYSGNLGKYDDDYTYFVESNMGANKANLFVERMLNKNVYIDDNQITSENEIIIKNIYDSNKDYSKWGGIYLNYQRIIVPNNSYNLKVFVDNSEYTLGVTDNLLTAPKPEDDKSYTIEEYKEFKIIGFWMIIPKNSSTNAKVYYSLPKNNDYKLLLKRQPGIISYPFTLTFNNQEFVNTEIYKDTEFQIVY